MSQSRARTAWRRSRARLPGRPRASVAVLLLISASLPSCGQEGQSPSGQPPAVDTGAVLPPDTSPAAEAAVRDVVDTAGPPTGRPPVAGGEGAPGPAPGAAQDSLQDLVGELRRLAASNDSLRAALHALSGRIAAGPGAQARADTARGLQGLPVDAVRVRSWGLRAVWAVVVLALTALLLRVTVWVVERLAERSPKRRLLFKRLIPVLRIVFWTLALVFIVRVVLEVGGQELLAAGAAIGVAVGFAAQDILKNIFGGLIVIFDQPFQVGDKVSVGGTYGEVVSIGLRSTRIVTAEDNLVTVPNAQVVEGQVANANAGELNCQVVTDLFLPGWADETLAKRIALEAAAGSRYVFLNKPIVILVKDEFRETFLLHLKVKAYVMDPRYEFLFQSDVTERAREGFRRAGLLGPFHGVRAWVDLDRHPAARNASEPSGPADEPEGA